MSIHRSVEFSWRRHSPRRSSGSIFTRDGPCSGSLGGGSGSGRSARMLYHFEGRSSCGKVTTRESDRILSPREADASGYARKAALGFPRPSRQNCGTESNNARSENDADRFGDLQAAGREHTDDLLDRDLEGRGEALRKPL